MGDRLRFMPEGGRVSAIRVLRAGIQTTVQDLGRFGLRPFGVSASGAADALALRAGNLLVGNAENAPALEMTLTGGAFEFEADATIALTGSDFGAGLFRCGNAVRDEGRRTLCAAAPREPGRAAIWPCAAASHVPQK